MYCGCVALPLRRRWGSVVAAGGGGGGVHNIIKHYTVMCAIRGAFHTSV